MDKNYGVATVGTKGEMREIKISEYVRSIYNDNRVVSCSKLEDDSYIISVENLQSSGRNPSNQMWLSKESFLGLIANSLLYFEIKGTDIIQLAKEATGGKEIKYTISDNLSAVGEKFDTPPVQ